MLTAAQYDRVCIFPRWIAYPPSARPEVHPFPRRIHSLQHEFLTVSYCAVVAVDVNLDGGIKSHPGITWGPLHPKRLGVLRYAQVHATENHSPARGEMIRGAFWRCRISYDSSNRSYCILIRHVLLFIRHNIYVMSARPAWLTNLLVINLWICHNASGIYSVCN